MKFFLIFLLVCVFGNATVFAQSKADSIAIIKKGHNYHYAQNGKELTMKQLSATLRSDPAAKKLMGESSSDRFWVADFAGAGAGCIAFELYKSLTGAKIQPGVIVAGAAFIALSISTSISAGRLAKKAVRAYNEDLRKTSFKTMRPQYYLSFSGTRIGLTMRF